jgi:hypothetical protein
MSAQASPLQPRARLEPTEDVRLEHAVVVGDERDKLEP